jgi:hypothetical protein
MTAPNEHAVGTVGKGVENVLYIDPRGAHHPDQPDMRGILKARHAT